MSNQAKMSTMSTNVAVCVDKEPDFNTTKYQTILCIYLIAMVEAFNNTYITFRPRFRPALNYSPFQFYHLWVFCSFGAYARKSFVCDMYSFLHGMNMIVQAFDHSGKCIWYTVMIVVRDSHLQVCSCRVCGKHLPRILTVQVKF